MDLMVWDKTPEKQKYQMAMCSELMSKFLFMADYLQAFRKLMLRQSITFDCIVWQITRLICLKIKNIYIYISDQIDSL